ncbi:hypothetical protein [uncultured Tateyamaria sp.]|uniref:hypothetical protein n=1 Tax=uncultured Tateyamaria sp. TaxID=455651 RepID=UPI00342C3324
MRTIRSHHFGHAAIPGIMAKPIIDMRNAVSVLSAMTHIQADVLRGDEHIGPTHAPLPYPSYWAPRTSNNTKYSGAVRSSVQMLRPPCPISKRRPLEAIRNGKTHVSSPPSHY